MCPTCGVRGNDHDPKRWGYCMAQSMLEIIDKHFGEKYPVVAKELSRPYDEDMWEYELGKEEV